jgi:hypothetical protein
MAVPQRKQVSHPKGHSVCWIGVINIEEMYQQYLPIS